MNNWYSDSWKAMTWGQLTTFSIAFFFWCGSFANTSTGSYLYLFVLAAFAGLYGFYITATTIIFQFQAIKGFSTMDNGLKESEIWGAFGIYTAVQVMAAFLGQHYLFDSVMYLLSAEIKEWCEAHPGVCDDYGVLSRSEE